MTDLQSDTTELLTDGEVWASIERERDRQERQLELIASENHASREVMAASGTCLTNKYAEGYPGRRYYGGCEHVDEVGNLARERAKAVFGARYANVQPHSGTQANLEVYMAVLEAGDVVTHCFKSFPRGIMNRHGRPVPEAWAALERGVRFDIGHGMGSFGFATAEAMLAAGFYPDCISSDVHDLSVHGPAYDQLVTLSKLLNLGMPLDAVIAASTSGPAEVIGHPELGSLAVGTPADASVLRLEDGHMVEASNASAGSPGSPP